jgi:hypothetical protein
MLGVADAFIEQASVHRIVGLEPKPRRGGGTRKSGFCCAASCTPRILIGLAGYQAQA